MVRPAVRPVLLRVPAALLDRIDRYAGVPQRDGRTSTRTAVVLRAIELGLDRLESAPWRPASNEIDLRDAAGLLELIGRLSAGEPLPREALADLVGRLGRAMRSSVVRDDPDAALLLGLARLAAGDRHVDPSDLQRALATLARQAADAFARNATASSPRVGPQRHRTKPR